MKNKKITLSILSFLIVLTIIFGLIFFNLKNDNYLELTFFDVGQGDSTFIETSHGYQILIDGGPDSSVLEKLEKEMFSLDRTIDLIILSHPEHDHIAGLIEVLKRYEVGHILWNGVDRDSSELVEWNNLLEEKGTKVFIAKGDFKIYFGESEFLKVIYPFKSLEGELVEGANETSIVFKLVFGETSFLFTGDISKEVEKDILDKEIDVDADVLKIAHHGSKYSTSEEFLISASPNSVVIFSGRDNSYGHPHPEVLELLNKYGINIFRTDLNGDIKLISDKNKVYGFSNI
ncbi:MAG: MBL fold metallo-hydrolase [Candidatus Nealsonbacteria bacterium]